MKIEEPTVQVMPCGFPDEFPEGPPSAVVSHRGCKVVLRFARGDQDGDGLVQELRLLPDDEQLEPGVLRRFAPQAELYLAYARAAMRLEATTSGEYTEESFAGLRGAAEVLREIGGPGRSMPPEFFRKIALQYRALVAGGEPYPVKALGEANYVSISGASRWVKEARRLGYLEPKEARS